MLSRFASRLADWAQRWVPDPFVIALGLTVVAFGLGWLAMDVPIATDGSEGSSADADPEDRGGCEELNAGSVDGSPLQP